MSQVVTRFAPSPTGALHVGGARTALFSYLFARQKDGKFILRIEDTDRERSKPEFEEVILESLKWLGLSWDEFYRQSERKEIYQKYLEKLLASGAAYWADEEKGKVIRFKNPGKDVIFQDEIRGEVKFNTADLGDFVVAKNLDEPLYHLAVVIDDHEMGVTHVIRGEEHLSNTPRQILIAEAIGANKPIYAHIPLLLAPDRSKLSKRHGAVSVLEYKNQGYLPEALINFLAFLGWNPGTDQELFSLDELVKEFRLERVQKGAAVFNQEKLNWFNREYLKRLPESVWIAKIEEFFPSLGEKLLPLIRERISTLGEIAAMAKGGEWNYLFGQPSYEKALLKNQTHLAKLISLLESVPESDFTLVKIKSAVWDFATEVGRGEVLWPMRVALTGKEKSPDPFTVAALLGKIETLKRLEHAQSL